jgi:hypothetical protein
MVLDEPLLELEFPGARDLDDPLGGVATVMAQLTGGSGGQRGESPAAQGARC